MSADRPSRSSSPLLVALAALLTAGGALTFVIPGRAQERAPSISTSDPRASLKAGFRDPGVAIRNMEHLANLPKPEGFYDPEAPAGAVSPPERPAGAPEPAPPAPNAPPPPPPRGSGFTNSDLAFQGQRAIVGNYYGFNTYDIENPRRPRLLASVICPGGQGDVSIYGNLLFMSVEQTRGRIDCGTEGVQVPVSAERFRGVRIFDISDVNKPRQVAAVQTCRGSHTHTLVPDPKDKTAIYVYGSGTGPVRSGDELSGCVGDEKDTNTALFSIDVIKVPLDAPEKAAIVNRPRIFADPSTGALALPPVETHGQGGAAPTRQTNQCHDITVFPEIGLAAGACSGNGILMDIADPVHPVRLAQVADKNFAYWHSATFNNDGTKVVFTDEWGGGGRPRCRATDPPTWGADAIFDIVDRKLQFRGYYKLPAAQTDQENCVAHNGSLIPVPGRDIMVQAWYQGGISVFDFTDSSHPVEIAYFDRGPIDPANLVSGGYWSAYWYNGNIYGSEIARGIDVLRLTPSEYLTQNEIDAAVLARREEFNAQLQPKVEWPATVTVARAYYDQLMRDQALGAARATAVKNALDRLDQSSGTRTALDQIDALATTLESDARTAKNERTADRLRALAATMKARAARLRG